MLEERGVVSKVMGYMLLGAAAQMICVHVGSMCRGALEPGNDQAEVLGHLYKISK